MVENGGGGGGVTWTRQSDTEFEDENGIRYTRDQWTQKRILDELINMNEKLNCLLNRHLGGAQGTAGPSSFDVGGRG